MPMRITFGAIWNNMNHDWTARNVLADLFLHPPPNPTHQINFQQWAEVFNCTISMQQQINDK